MLRNFATYENSEISNSQSRPIRSTLTLHPKEEHLRLSSLKASTSKPNSVTQDALMNEYDASNLNATLVNKCKSRMYPTYPSVLDAQPVNPMVDPDLCSGPGLCDLSAKY